MEQKALHILDFLGKIKTANNETVQRELFTNRLLRLFDEDERARTKALGAKTAIRIPLKRRNKTGYDFALMATGGEHWKIDASCCALLAFGMAKATIASSNRCNRKHTRNTPFQI